MSGGDGGGGISSTSEKSVFNNVLGEFTRRTKTKTGVPSKRCVVGLRRKFSHRVQCSEGTNWRDLSRGNVILI